MRSSTLSIATLALVANSIAAYVPNEPWSTLTPSATLSSPHTTDYTKTFAISIHPIPTPVSKKVVKRDVVTQIGDGQIQATTAAPKPNPPVVTQIGDGQIQATTETPICQLPPPPKPTATVVTQIGDGQIQATTATAVTQIGDGQIQATAAAHEDGKDEKPVHGYDDFPESCKVENALSMTLNKGILTDGKGRIGSIVSNRQFQFDGPPPQAGAIYAAGWAVTEDGDLALGDQTVFYQCLSGNFYNLYDQHIGTDCQEINFKIIDLVDC
ncbi:hypothetical protein CANINC_001130 [Pichia inconspicua]|uniref:Cell wall mannoprotein PIR1-like C-terminal domain-containing protein n=1 Tax=Pichia inconspicua TaxID=52247 RepID=A0A4V4NG17_9ASCO|nr:hypothetical protein CANINC_001130 [[Candida] inconspicua]